jgi:hypothetical protein
MNFILAIFCVICPKARPHQFKQFNKKSKHTEVVYEDVNDIELIRDS